MRPEEHEMHALLAAYAAGGLDPDEREAAERYLAAHPEAQEELAVIRETLDAVRAAAVRPRVEPAWEDMAAAISQACDEAMASPGPDMAITDVAMIMTDAGRDAAVARGRTEAGQSWLGWAKAKLAALMRPRYVIGMAVMAAAVVLVLQTSGDSPERPPVSPVAVSGDRPESPDPEEGSEDLADLSEDTELAELGSEELDRAYELLADDAAIASLDTDNEEDALAEATDTVLEPAMIAEWLGAQDGADGSSGEDSDELGLFAPSDYDALLEELSEEELERLDTYLQEAQAG